MIDKSDRSRLSDYIYFSTRSLLNPIPTNRVFPDRGCYSPHSTTIVNLYEAGIDYSTKKFYPQGATLSIISYRSN